MGNHSPSSQESRVTQVVRYSPPDVRFCFEGGDGMEELEMTCILVRCHCMLCGIKKIKLLFGAFNCITLSSFTS